MADASKLKEVLSEFRAACAKLDACISEEAGEGESADTGGDDMMSDEGDRSPKKQIKKGMF